MPAEWREDPDGYVTLLVGEMLPAAWQWWQTNVPEAERAGTTPEARLAEACVRFLDAHTR